MTANKQLDVLKHCDMVVGGYAIDACELEHAMGWPMGKLAPRIELFDSIGHKTTVVRFSNSRRQDGEVTAWEFASDDGETLTVYND